MDEVSKVLGTIHPSLEKLHGLPLAIFLLVAALTLVFLVGYGIQGTRVWWQIRTILKALRKSRKTGTAPVPDEIGRAFRWEPLKHLWVEYSHTLHDFRKAGSGATSLTEVRATIPAESMFTKEVLVDGRLFDEFTRHLPGVLTGLGIIGTFAGLLDGLKDFTVLVCTEN